MGKIQQYRVGSHNILDYQKSPGIDLLISGRLGPIPGGVAILLLTRNLFSLTILGNTSSQGEEKFLKILKYSSYNIMS